MSSAHSGDALSSDRSPHDAYLDLGLAAIAQGDFNLARKYLAQTPMGSTDGDFVNGFENSTVRSQQGQVSGTGNATSNADYEDCAKYLLAKINILSMQTRQISDAVQRYDPSALRKDLRQDVTEIVEAHTRHLKEVVEACVDEAVAKLEGESRNKSLSQVVGIQSPSAELAQPLCAFALKSDTKKEREGPSSEPDHKPAGRVTDVPLSLQPAAYSEQVIEKKNIGARISTLGSDKESAKALAGIAGWSNVDSHPALQPDGRPDHIKHVGGQSKLLQFVHSTPFEIVTTLLIFGNAMFAGVVADVSIRNAVNGEPQNLPLAYKLSQAMFTVSFCIEWLFRLLAHGSNFFTCQDNYWHMLDTIVMLLSSLDLIISFAVNDGFATSTLLRLVRIFRVVRALRMVRVLKVFRELRYIIMSLRKSVHLLLWPIVLLILMGYMCAVMVAATIQGELRKSTDGNRRILVDYFGSLSSTLKSLLLSVAGARDWSDVAGALSSVDFFSFLPVLVYMCIARFLIFNLLSGIFVLSVFENCRVDEQRTLREHLLSKNSSGAQLRSIFSEMDVTGTGSIHLDNLEGLRDDPLVTDSLNDLDMTVNEMAGLAKLLDVDSDGYVDIEELLLTMFMVRANSQSVNLPSLMRESWKIGRLLITTMQDSEGRISELKGALRYMQNLQQKSYEATLALQNSQVAESC